MPLVLLANRAPLRPTAAGWAPAAGGLTTALLPVLDRRGGAWIAMREPGEDAPDVQEVPGGRATVYRVPLTAAEVDAYYLGMSNRVLWPLSHYLVDHVEPDRGFRDAYAAVNRRFAEAALAAAESTPRARFWVHDYHLMHVPAHLRAARPDARIGVFWHIPWPAPEVFRVLPAARDLLRGMLGADLVGFHTERYAENFRAAARDLLGADVEGHSVVWEGRRLRTEAHPIGIDVAAFEALREAPETVAEAAGLRASLLASSGGTGTIVAGVDRLDYTKGLPERLAAFEAFLETYPEHRGRVTLVQVATPSRAGIPAYDQLKRDVDEAVGRINGRFGEGAWTPVLYRYRQYAQTELAVLYRAADVALVTPLRDGMNLVAQEYALTTEDGVLLLSELAGASDVLDGAVAVNPYDAVGVAEALHAAVGMAPEARAERLGRLRASVRRLDVHDWAETFLTSLDAAAAKAARRG